MITETILANERELFAEMAGGSQAAFNKIFYYYSQRLYFFIYQKVKSELYTEEIIQEVFIKLWKKREELNEVENCQAYLFKMAANRTYDHLRKVSNDARLKAENWKNLLASGNATQEKLDFKESQQLIWEAIDKLSPQRKKIFLYSRQLGLTQREIAEKLNLSPNTVNNHLSTALGQVRELFCRNPGVCFILLLLFGKIALF
jgi:RNA polymerase sigma-70 factor (family 1)